MFGPYCPYANSCWRLAYTKYVLTDQFNGNNYPSRLELALLGYIDLSFVDVTYTKRGKARYPGLFCRELPTRKSGHCPDFLVGNSYHGCNEYQNERNRVEKYRKTRQRKEYKKREFIPRSVYRLVYRRDKFTCQYCNRNINILKLQGEKLVLDHIIPWSRGGSNDPSNLILACDRCNSEKSDDIGAWSRGCAIGKYD